MTKATLKSFFLFFEDIELKLLDISVRYNNLLIFKNLAMQIDIRRPVKRSCGYCTENVTPLHGTLSKILLVDLQINQ